MEKGFRLRKKRTGQWVCLAGVTLALATMGSQLVSAEQVPWVARTVEMVKKDLKESKDSTTYLIKWGDTLSVIAKAVDMDMNILAQINKIANVDLIYAGNTLSISKDGKRIVVDNGDTAQAYRVVEPAPAESRTVENPEPARVERVAEFDSQDRQAIQNYVDRGQIAPVAPTTSNRPQTEVTRPRPITEPSRQGETGTSNPIRPILPGQPLIPSIAERPSNPAQPGSQPELPSQPSTQERPVVPSQPSETGTQAEHPSQPSPQERPVAPSHPSETGIQAEHPSQPKPQERPVAPSQPSETETQAEHPSQPSTQENPATPVTPAPVVENATNLSELVANDKSAIPLPVVHEEVLSETVREETVTVESAPTESAPETPKPIESTPTPAATETAPTEASSGETEASSTPTSPETGASETSPEVSSPAPSQPTPSPVEQPSSPATKTVKVLERVVRVTETIPYPVVYQEDDSLAAGETKVLSEGTMGATVTMQTVTLKDGVEVSRETSSTSTTEAVSRVVKVGTRKASMPAPVPSQPAKPAEEKPQTKQLPQKETVYTEVTNRTSPKEVTDQKELENILKDATAQLAIPSMTNDKLATTNLVTIYDNTLFEGRKQLENIQASYVTVAVKRKREVQGQEDQVETLLTKDIPVFTGTVRIGTRKAGYETKTSSGQTVTLSSKEGADKLAAVKIYDNISPDFAKRNPAYLGAGVTLASDKPIGKSELSINYDASALRADSHPTIYRSDATGKLVEVPTSLQGNTAVATVTQLGTYVLMDKKEVPSKKIETLNWDEAPTAKSPRTVSIVYDTVTPVTSITKGYKTFPNGGRLYTDIPTFSTVNDKGNQLAIELAKQLIDKLDSHKDSVNVGLLGQYSAALDEKYQGGVETHNNGIINYFNHKDFSGAKEALDIALTEKNMDLNVRFYDWNPYKNKELQKKNSNISSEIFITTKDRPLTETVKKDVDSIYTKSPKYIIGFNFENHLQDSAYTYLAEKTNGKFFYAKDISELPAIFKEIEERILDPEEVNRKDTDKNNDGISAYLTKEIYKGNLLSEDGRQVYAKTVEMYRKDLKDNILSNPKAFETVTDSQLLTLKDYSSLTEKQKKEIFNPIIDRIDASYFEEKTKPDLDGDGVLNGYEAIPEVNPETGKVFLKVVSEPERDESDKDGDGILGYQTLEILKGNLLSEDGRQVYPEFVDKKRREEMRQILNGAYNKITTPEQRKSLENYDSLTEKEKQAIFNPIFDQYLSGVAMKADLDGDGRKNGEEAAIIRRPSDGKEVIRVYTDPELYDGNYKFDNLYISHIKSILKGELLSEDGKQVFPKEVDRFRKRIAKDILESRIKFTTKNKPEITPDMIHSLENYNSLSEKEKQTIFNPIFDKLIVDGWNWSNYPFLPDVDSDGIVNGKEVRVEMNPETGKLFLRVFTDPEKDELDHNGDGIPALLTKEIFKGNVLTRDGQQLFKQQVESYRQYVLRKMFSNYAYIRFPGTEINNTEFAIVPILTAPNQITLTSKKLEDIPDYIKREIEKIINNQGGLKSEYRFEDAKLKDINVSVGRILKSNPEYSNILKGKMRDFDDSIYYTDSKLKPLINYESATEEEKQAFFNPLFDAIPAYYFEDLLAADIDKDGVPNGAEARVEVDPETGKTYLNKISDPNDAASTPANPDALPPMPILPPTPAPEPPALIVPITDTNPITTNTSPENQLKTFSSANDTDGDGYDDAMEHREGKNPLKWDVSPRDMAILSSMIYLSKNELSDFNNSVEDILNKIPSDDTDKKIAKLFDKSEESNKLVEDLKKAIKDKVLSKRDEISDIGLEDTDTRFFANWKFLPETFLDDKYERKDNFRSTVAAFINRITNDVIVAYRGTDEGFWELAKDHWINWNGDLVRFTAEKQIREILLNKLPNLDKKAKLYITGHSLGGYEAYHAAVQVLENKTLTSSYQLEKVINFNGPGIHVDDTALGVAVANSQYFDWYAVDSLINLFLLRGANFGFMGWPYDSLKHPSSPIKFTEMYKKNAEQIVGDANSHKMISFFADRIVDSGSTTDMLKAKIGMIGRNTPSDKFDERNLFKMAVGTGSAVGRASWEVEKYVGNNITSLVKGAFNFVKGIFK